MKKTVRLFDADAYLREFTAKVISCDAADDSFLTVLDRTAFFPEEGGQSPDTGKISGSAVKSVFEKDGVIYHATEKEFLPGDEVLCRIDFDERYRKMQSHTGEHVLCGVAHRLFGCENVGFHLSEEYVRVDLDVYLDREKVAMIEKEANRAIRGNHAVTAWYPSEEELSSLTFRSKDGIKGEVRLVKIEDVDLCACCAPHVKSTSEVGMLKVTDSIKYKGGTRLEIVCGPDAVELFIKEHAALTSLAESFSVARDDVAAAVDRLREELANTAYRLRHAERELMAKKLETLESTDGALCFFFEAEDPEAVREFLNGAANLCRVAAGFIGKEKDYRYIIRSEKDDLKALAPSINGAISGRGGGSPAMITGKCGADRKTVEEFFNNYK
ncbi:MAG: alanyl-tRNA editing protein [Clostridia bacterium]|nr:alanyl-tRNA editing protein [Clostridia bacterium]